MIPIDLRGEPSLDRHSRTSESLSGDRAAYLDHASRPLFREGDHPSSNARTMLDALKGKDWRGYFKLADVIDSGDAKETEAEHDVLYEGFPLLADAVIDLYNMVSRRDDEIARLEAEVQAYAEAEAGASL